MRNRTLGVYWLTIRVIPPVCIAALLTGFVGGYLNSRAIWNAGVAIFLFGDAMWGLTNGGALAWSYVRAGRKLGAHGFAEDFAANPIKSALFILLALWFIAIGVGLAYAALRCALPR